MKVKLSYTGYLKLEGAKTGSYVDFEEGSTLGDLLDRFAVAPAQQRFLRLFANGQPADSSYLLRDGDELTVIVQIAGG